ncbi:MAG TPA: ANTAR domain-containing protein [Nevskiaceae bacterium]|nr:ANTAR domain-containing protein [Nevskiaceae bacterium]
MLVDGDKTRSKMLESTLSEHGHSVVARLSAEENLAAAVAQYQPQVVLLHVDSPGHATLESLGQVHRENPRPVVLFAARSDADTTRRAVQAGVSAYIVDGLQPARISAVLEVAIARFELHQSMRSELDKARTRLSDSRDIEKAKGLLMKRRGIDEAEAFSLLRRMAMDRQQRLGDVARMLLGAADVI